MFSGEGCSDRGRRRPLCRSLLVCRLLCRSLPGAGSGCTARETRLYANIWRPSPGACENCGRGCIIVLHPLPLCTPSAHSGAASMCLHSLGNKSLAACARACVEETDLHSKNLDATILREAALIFPAVVTPKGGERIRSAGE